MSIVIELQKAAIDSNSDILSLLRKAYLIARKLEISDFQEWISSELNGYEDYDKIPDYRMITGSLKGWNPYHGWIPVVIPDSSTEDAFHTRKLFDSIPSLVNIINETDNNVLSYSFDGKTLETLCRMTGHASNYTLQFSKNAIVNIVEQVKNKILEWALLLEENGILGEGLQFTAEEKEKVYNIPQIVNYVSNFYGDVRESQVQQGTTDSVQNRST
ncbi:hypothetical protein ACQRBN_01615 [Bariatricus sp. SGI.154]|uniref:AbiTii domain-containing protein n=1 Tax=Bariatricus sp. SGI.154 TaxID=3420549 RepID=UPI003D0202B8